ncbi:glycosyltransferase [Candidatus Pelagibacter communis]|uniref:glycosyltransferase n=1 Tax=Pelagibacter ubique TaxID=198252 RepID=UPI00094DC5D8|nr:glycosyltransferase [Candidatus Pelagibacter ubique]|tara:strand:+ start:69 stop:1226 length:1158 start_codon:yes stop_codon:yes gene_type:complete
MNKNLKVYYWAPFTSKVATIRAVINSAFSLEKYSKNKIKTKIIDASGEWSEYFDEIKKSNIGYIKLNNHQFFEQKTGYFNTRLNFIKIFIKCFFPLKKLIQIEKPDYVIIHLITSLPLVLNYILNLKTKMILRVSGLPKMNFLRKLFWKIVLKKVFLITCPTEETRNDLLKYNFCKPDKIVVLFDPIINVKLINKYKKENIVIKNEKNYFLAIGRFTKQKNFLFLLKVFSKLLEIENKSKLVLIGEGEKESELKDFIFQKKLNNNISIINYQKNIFPFINKSKCFLLPSLWEDPGFVLIENAYCNIPIISSNCKNGPTEILDYGKGGFLFNNNSEKEFLDKLIEFNQSKQEEIKKKILFAKKKAKNFTIFSHYLRLKEILYYDYK